MTCAAQLPPTHRSLAGRAFALVAACLTCLALPARASDLMGPESCRSCHAEAYKTWAAGPHARAAQSLDEKQSNSPLCLYCHSRDEARAGQAAVSGVSCETCHGGGRFYQPEIVMRDKELSHMFGLADLSGPNTQTLCLSCHGGEQAQVKPFDLKASLQRIDHWSADRARRKALKQTGSNEPPKTQLAKWLASAGKP